MTDLEEAYEAGWQAALSLAMARLRPMTECAFTAQEAVENLQQMAETGAHHPDNRAGTAG